MPNCVWCHQPFSSRQSRTTACSARCGRLAFMEKAGEGTVTRNCLTCGAAFTVRAISNAGFCGDACRLERKRQHNKASQAKRQRGGLRAALADMFEPRAVFTTLPSDKAPPPPPDSLPCGNCANAREESRSDTGYVCTREVFMTERAYRGFCREQVKKNA